MRRAERLPRQTQNDDAPIADTPDGPVRQCAATRDRLPQAEMIRFARAPDGTVTPDLAARLPGRGVWLKADRAALDLAEAKGAFARGFKAQATSPPALADLIEGLLIKQLQGTLGLAKKAGQVVLGFDQVRAALRSKPPGVLLQAADGAEDSRKKVYFLAKGIYETVEVSCGLTSTELGMAFGRSDVIHALLESGAFSSKWMADYNRLIGFRPAPEAEWYSGA